MLIGIVLFVAFVSLLMMHFTAKGGSKVVISLDGEVYGTYDLNKDDVIYIETDDGTNTVKIDKGVVSMIEASCPDQICVNTYPISIDEPGIIVCLPHKISVEIKE